MGALCASSDRFGGIESLPGTGRSGPIPAEVGELVLSTQSGRLRPYANVQSGDAPETSIRDRHCGRASALYVSTATRRTIADAGSARSASRHASSRERVGQVFTCNVIGRCEIGVGSHVARR
jgi:hypothetical protein